MEIQNPKSETRDQKSEGWEKSIRSIDPALEQSFAEMMVQIKPIIYCAFHGRENRKKTEMNHGRG